MMIQEVAGLAANTKAMVGSQRGGNTDLHAVFVRRLLPLAVTNCVQRKDMVKQLFVFSDMQIRRPERGRKSRAGRRTTTRSCGLMPRLGTTCSRSCTGISLVGSSGREWHP